MEPIKRVFSPPSDSYFLFGPRGTGKSTLLRSQYPGALVVDLLDPETYRSYLARPERLRELVEGNPQARRVIVDEVQKVPALLDMVHLLVEDRRRRTMKFVLSGSSARKLKHAGVNLLAGRLLMKTLHPFMAAEIGPRFSLEKSLQLGLLPLVLFAEDPPDKLKSYVTLYLREEVAAEGLVRNAGDFARCLETISLSQGSQLNVSDAARECQVGRKTVEAYVEIIEDLLLGFRVDLFTKRAKRHLAGHPKFYFADTGVFRSVRPRGPLDSPEEIGGACLEGLVAQHLRAWIAYSAGEHRLHYWRTKSGTEVDFVVYGDKTFHAIEVKSSRSVHAKDVKSLRTFIEDYPQAKACLLYRGRERLKINGIPCIPCEEFLLKLAPGSPLPA